MDICDYLGGRKDRTFLGMGNNLAVVVDLDYRIIYGDKDLGKICNLAKGKVERWHPSHINLHSTDPDITKNIFVTKEDILGLEIKIRNRGSESKKYDFSLDGNIDPSYLLYTELKGKYLIIHNPLIGLPLYFHFCQVVGASIKPKKVISNKGYYCLRYEVVVEPRKEKRICFGMSLSPFMKVAIANLDKVVKNRYSISMNKKILNDFFEKEVPQFECSDPYIQKLYYFRWYSLFTKMINSGFGYYSKYPVCREGVVGFSSLNALSGSVNSAELKWMRNPEWAYGTIRTLFENMPGGYLPHHIQADSLNNDTNCKDSKGRDFFYSNYLTFSLLETYKIHPDKRVLSELYPSLRSNLDFYESFLDIDKDNLFEIYPWSCISAGEWRAQSLYFHPLEVLRYPLGCFFYRFDSETSDVIIKWREKINKAVCFSDEIELPNNPAEMFRRYMKDYDHRQEAVDISCFAYLEFRSIAAIAEILSDEKEALRYQRKAKDVVEAILRNMWDKETEFFYDLDTVSHKKAWVKGATGFYPFFAGICDQEYTGIFRHLFNTNEFWSKYPIPALSMDYPKFKEMMEYKDTFGIWNYYNWPLTTSHVCYAVLDAAKRYDESLRKGANDFFHRYVRLHFLNDDLNKVNISEHYDPFSGEPNAPQLDYAHSLFLDLVFRHIIGLEPSLEEEVVLLPFSSSLDYFQVKNVQYKNHTLEVEWIKPGTKYEHSNGSGYKLYVDGKLVAKRNALQPIRHSLG